MSDAIVKRRATYDEWMRSFDWSVFDVATRRGRLCAFAVTEWARAWRVAEHKPTIEDVIMLLGL